MGREVTSKNIEGITELVVVAPIKQGFIDAFETVTFETRLRIVAEALHNIRVAAREHERIEPFSDTTERILTLLDFRIGIVDRDVFEMGPAGASARRFLYLAATFDGAWEPYMRLIWRPLGVFLDLLFCNCEGYKPAYDHSFREYAEWVRSAQVDSAIFYATTGMTVRDELYLRKLERVHRDTDPAESDLAIAKLTMPDPERLAREQLEQHAPESHALALEAVTVLYRLADYYPPDRMDPADRTGWRAPDPAIGTPGNYTFAEGRYLLRAAQNLLPGWDPSTLKGELFAPYFEAINWFMTKDGLDSLAPTPEDPPFDPEQVQSGILKTPGSTARPVEAGALMLMTVTDAAAARRFIGGLELSWGDVAPEDGMWRSIAFSAHGLKRLGMPEDEHRRFPKEFREGMEKRAGLIGDMYLNHPREWILPPRNWPEVAPGDAGLPPRPPIDTSEIDFVIQLRHAPGEGERENSAAAVRAEIARLAALAEASGAVLAGYEPMLNIRWQGDPSGQYPNEDVGHFALRDSVSQPRAVHGLDDKTRGRDDVRLGEIICGYRNDHEDWAPQGEPGWTDYMADGTFLVVRKIEQKVDAYDRYMNDESARIAQELGGAFTRSDLVAKILGRKENGEIGLATGTGGLNDFDYSKDTEGAVCPFASHIRRCNPRDQFHGRPAPRIIRRGMSFGERGSADQTRGIMFLAYGASIAEQYETIQRWANGGNSTSVGSAQNDPLTGVEARDGEPRTYRFVVGDKVVRSKVPAFTQLHWGIYLFVPSRRTIARIANDFDGDAREIEPRAARGRSVIDRINRLPRDARLAEWKRVIEDFDVKDPGERSITPDVWASIRSDDGGALRIPDARDYVAKCLTGTPLAIPDDDQRERGVVLVASEELVLEVLSTPDIYSVEVQGHRMRREHSDLSVYVAMQPGDQYAREAPATNDIMYALTPQYGFDLAYRCAVEALAEARKLPETFGHSSFKLELRRDFLIPTLGAFCHALFGLPDVPRGEGKIMSVGGWNWSRDMNAIGSCPGDFLSPSRHAFYPQPSEAVMAYADIHAARVRRAGDELVKQLRADPDGEGAVLSRKMARVIGDDDMLSRNILGMIIGFLPPVDGCLRGILYEWLSEHTIGRHQGTLRRAVERQGMDFETAYAALWGPIARAMCKRPAPDLLLRIATQDHQLTVRGKSGRARKLKVRAGDLVIACLVSATQETLMRQRDGDYTLVFGGNRGGGAQAQAPFHACPAQKLMVGAMTGIYAALLNAGNIRPLPASLIVELSGWK